MARIKVRCNRAYFFTWRVDGNGALFYRSPKYGKREIVGLAVVVGDILILSKPLNKNYGNKKQNEY